MVTRHIFCSDCGAQGEAGCDCGAEYISASAFAARAIARNPGKSNRVLAEEIGVNPSTVDKARNELPENPATEKRQGQDGKMYPSKRKFIRRAKADEAVGYSPKAERQIDERTGECISRVEAIKREAATKATRDLESEVIELRAEVTRLNAELTMRPSMDDMRRMDAVANHTQRITTDIETYNLFRRCLHPDSRNSVSDDILHKAWLAFRNLEPHTYDKSKIPPPLPTGLDELFRMKEAAEKKRKARHRDVGRL